MATGPIKNPNPTEKTGTFTPSSGITVSELRVKQIGKVVEVHFYATKSSTFGSSEVVLGSISGVDSPPTIIRKNCATGAYAYEATTNGYCYLGSTGTIGMLSGNSAHKVVVIDFVYTVN